MYSEKAFAVKCPCCGADIIVSAITKTEVTLSGPYFIGVEKRFDEKGGDQPSKQA